MEKVNELLERYKNDPTACEIVRALGVVVMTPHIVTYLELYDPNALLQAQKALGMVDRPPLEAAIARFPDRFGLKAFHGDVFRVSRTSSYMSEGKPMLYTERLTEKGWQSFAKGTEAELLAEVVKLP